jgi:hypothetical protein
MLSRRRIAFSHVIYTSGVFFLTVAFALIAVVALTLRFAGGRRCLRAAVGPADGDNAKLIEAIARHLERDGGRKVRRRPGRGARSRLPAHAGNAAFLRN